MNYKEFLKHKEKLFIQSGFESELSQLNLKLFEWQRHLVRWTLKKGKAAIFADCGLGKTPMQLEWAYQVHKYTNKPVLILAPLAVSKQTRREGLKFDISVNICESQIDIINGVNITNYEKLEKFDCGVFGGIVLDESSILKSFTGSTKQMLIDKFKYTPYKLCCTATPSPNDFMELGNHSEFLGIMSRTEMLATYFVHDMSDTQKWRLKGHAEVKFWEWLATWSVVMRSPDDIGFYGCAGYDLPPLNINVSVVESPTDYNDNEQISMFKTTAQTLNERRQARKDSINERVEKGAEIINGSCESWLCWCDFNAESESLTARLNGAVQITGSDKPEHKENSVVEFADGKIKVLVSKPSICGFGINWQNCHNIMFCGLSDSYEQFYQAVRRCWRFGQTKEVNVYIIISERETAILDNIKRKESDMQRMISEMIKLTKNTITAEIHNTVNITEYYKANAKMQLPKWIMEDCNL